MAECSGRTHTVWYLLSCSSYGMVAVQVPHHSRHTSP